MAGSRRQTPEGQVLEQMKWLLTLLARRGLLTWTRIHVMPVLRGRRAVACACGAEHSEPILSKNPDMEGFADLEIVVAPEGRVGYIETKSERGRLSESQELFRDARARVGAPYFVVRSLDDGISALRHMGVDVDRVIKGIAPRSHSVDRLSLASP